ncbi:MAG: acetoacetate--CoA ligase [Gammaproteobacteria bacterium]
MIKTGDLLWTPGPDRVANAKVTQFMHWLKDKKGLEFPDYQSLWQWSVDDQDAFWEAIWQYFDVRSSTPYEKVLGRREMPGAEWFPGARLNYAENMLRREQAGKTAVYFLSERTPLTSMTWDELGNSVRILATRLREMGIQPGDRVVSYMPNIPETLVAMLATTSIGAIWSSSSPDFGTQSVLDRFAQIEPKALFCIDGYQYGGKEFDRREAVGRIVGSLDTLEHVIYLPYLDETNTTPPVSDALLWQDLLNRPPVPAAEFEFEQVPFDHPLWILFSSGTTGLPKAIVHGHGGITIEHMKLLSFHRDLGDGDRIFFFTTTGWMMWNFLASSLLGGVIPVLYDGNPAWPEPDLLWKMVEETGANGFGASPTYVQHMQNAGIVPRDKYDMSSLQGVTLAGSPVTPESMQWMYENVKEDLWVEPGSGGTDICSGFVEGVPTLPVYAGEIQARALGVAAYAFNDAGKAVIDEVGELVVTKPMPSMPLYFWDDEGNKRYLESYFEEFPGVWRHGDFFMVNRRGGCFVLGRSDATLNRYGVRIGTAEIYRSVNSLDEVEDSLIVNLELQAGKFFMPLFVRLAEGATLDEALDNKIRARLRADYSPRHVPDKIIPVDDIPYTLTGKKMEVPVKKVLLGKNVDDVANRDAMANPESLDIFVEYFNTQQDYTI